MLFTKQLTSAIILVVLAVFLTTGCAAQNNSARNSSPVKQPPAGQENKTALAPDAERKQIQTAVIALETTVLAETEKRLLNLAAANSGLVESSQVSMNADSRHEGRFVIRVPQENLAAMVEAIAGLPDSKLRSRSVAAQDVTEEYIDVNARLDNLRLQEQRLRLLLAQAATVDEIIKIEAEISKVRTQLDSTAGRLKSLAGRIAMAAVTVTISETASIQFNSYGGKLLGALREGFQAAGETLLVTITVMIGSAPAIVIFYGLWRLWKWWKRKFGQPKSSS